MFTVGTTIHKQNVKKRVGNMLVSKPAKMRLLVPQSITNLECSCGLRPTQTYLKHEKKSALKEET